MSVTKVHSVCGLKQWSRPQISTRHLISIIWSQFISRPNIRLQVLLLTNDNGLSELQKPPRFSYRWPNNAIVILAIVILTMPQGWLLIWVQCLTIECWRLGHRGWPIRSSLSLWWRPLYNHQQYFVIQIIGLAGLLQLRNMFSSRALFWQSISVLCDFVSYEACNNMRAKMGQIIKIFFFCMNW